ncbi:frizzled-8b [Triplophysa dalaica]|uniref:frizzled-8b n=1 Tax=Triplophysa dalaica TaxID=1582913 RepID=UPI0024DFB5D6|nr:frizzled-8b [Triplophysa dalaica]
MDLSAQVSNWLSFAICALLSWSYARAREPVCQEISVPLCRGIGYNYTYMPNQFNHDTQDEAGLEVHQFWPLVEIQCSPDLRFFLCSLYTPICLKDYKKPLPPCRSVCERAKAGCAPLMRQYGFPWPDRMSCDLLPVQGDLNTLCMDYNRTEFTTTSSAAAKPTRHPGKPSNRRNKSNNGRALGGQHRSGSSTCDPECHCRAPLVTVSSDRNPLFNRVKTGQIPNCAMPCHNPYFSQEERTFATFWIGMWSVLCFVSTFATVATFLIDMERFKYPERPIIFLSTCYMFVSAGYIIRLIAGHERVACNQDYEVDHIRYETTGPALCTLVFLLIYFFGMASSIWWVILTFTWFLAAGRKWGNEAIARYSQYFHLAAWLIPSVKCITALALSSVDGDSVAGICYVGNQNLDNLRGFVLAPLVIYLVMGTVFLLAGFVSMFRIRSIIKQGGAKADKLERLMVRIGIFTVLYTVLATVIVSCYVYELYNREAWENAHACSCASEKSAQRPDYGVLMLKYFLCLLVGITSGAWTWSWKTLDSWRSLCARRYGGKGTSGSVYSEASTRLTWRSGTASSVLFPPKKMPLSRV